jgi:protein TonB
LNASRERSPLMRLPAFDGGPAPLPPKGSRLRIALLLLILALHAGFYLTLKNGLLHKAVTALPSNIVTAVILPPEVPAVPKPAAPVVPKPPAKPPVTPPRKPPVQKPKAPAPTPPARPAPVPMPPEPAPQEAPAPAPPQAAPAPAAPPAPDTAPPRAPAAQAAPAAPKTISSGAQYLQPPQPEYPAQSRRLGEEGRVILRVLLDEAGRVGQVQVQKSSGFPRLDQAAIDAVQRARFKPHLEDGRPLAVYVMVPISFRLDQ